MRGSRVPALAGRRPGARASEEDRAGRGCRGAGPAGLVVTMFMLSVLGVGAAGLWRSDVAPAYSGEVEEIICKVGALFMGGTCPDDPTDRPGAGVPFPVRVSSAIRVMTPDGSPTDCRAWITEPFLDSDADGNRIVVAEAMLQCDTPRSMKVEAQLYRPVYAFPPYALVGSGTPSAGTHTMQVTSRYEYRCTTHQHRIYMAWGKYQIDLGSGQVVNFVSDSNPVPLDCD